MSMTREEAVELLCYGDWLNVISKHIGKTDTERIAEAMSIVGKALRPVSRERVERIWFREPYTRLETRQGDDGSIVYSAMNTCMACGHETPIGNFCHNCGAAQTVEGVELTMKRLEALKDGSTTD